MEFKQQVMQPVLQQIAFHHAEVDTEGAAILVPAPSLLDAACCAIPIPYILMQPTVICC